MPDVAGILVRVWGALNDTILYLRGRDCEVDGCLSISKWQIARAGVDSGTTLGLVGVGAILISAILTAIYMLQIILRAYYPLEDVEVETGKCDPTWRMLVPLFVFTAGVVLFGVFNAPLIEFFENVAGGLI